MPEYCEDGGVQSLTFTNPWIRDFLTHATLHNRKVVTSDKILPPVDEVQVVMADIALARSKYLPGETVSADETACLYGLAPKNQYVPEDARRGSAPDGDEKSRFTSMQTGDDKGEMLSSFNVVKCTTKANDLSNTRVLRVMHTKQGFSAAEGWELCLWKRELKLLNKKKEEFSATYTRPFLRHKASNIIITVQHKAWMDTAGVCMWIDLTLGPHFARKRKMGLLIWDNCGSHCVPAVLSLLVEWGIEQKKLPKNMTGKLQVMDLIVNGPYKAAIRRKRCAALFNYFQSWKITRLQELAKDADERRLPDFAPPKPDLLTGLTTSFQVEYELFNRKSFQDALRRTFVAAGQAPLPDGSFMIYTSHARSSISSYLLPEGKSEDSALASLIGSADVMAAEEEDEPATDDEVEDEATEE